MKQKTARGKSLWRGAQKLYKCSRRYSVYYRHSPLRRILLVRCFETPQTERLSAFVTVAEARGNVKEFFYFEFYSD